VLSPQLTGVEDNASLPYASSLCGACFDACPVKIDIPRLLVELRAQHVEARREEHPVPTLEALTMAAAAWTMARPRRWTRFQTLSRAGRLLARRSGRMPALPFPLAGWTASRELPVPPTETFRERWARERR
jgi:L-lactate dehydrogenase complex protein LldF